MKEWEQHWAFDPALLHHVAAVEVSGSRRDPAMLRVRHGFRVERAQWERLSPDQQHVALIVATDRSCRNAGQVFCRVSAAALWGLPRLGRWPQRVQILEADRSGRGSAVIQRHRGQTDTTAVLHGVHVTTVPRTVVDLARFDTVHQGVIAADHALHHRLCTREELLVELSRVGPGERGRRRAALVCAMADGRSMSVGESLSRVQMMLLRVPRPDLQVEYRDRDGLIGYVDFAWDGVVGEFDGRVKYRANATDSEPVEEVLWREKLREDRLRRQVRVARWTWSTAMDRTHLARTLAAQGLVAQRRGWFDREVLAEVA